MDTPNRDEMVLRLSRILDAWAEECLGDDPDWGPLERAIPRQWCGGFMWMNRIEADGVVIELYKHGITRRYLNLDQDNKAYSFTGMHIRAPAHQCVWPRHRDIRFRTTHWSDRQACL